MQIYLIVSLYKQKRQMGHNEARWNIISPTPFDSIKNAVQSNSIFQLSKENTIQIRNLDTNTLIPIPSNEELYVANAFNNNLQDEIACVSNLQNGLRIATLYNQSGTLFKITFAQHL